MADFDLNRVFETDYPGLSACALIGSASDYQKIIEEFLPVIQDQMTVRFRAEIRRKWPLLDEEDLSDDYKAHEWVTKGLLAGLLSGSVIIAAWSAFEQSITAMCKYAQRKEGVALSIEDLRENSLPKKVQKYLHVVTRNEFRMPYELADIQALRNLYAHHNGSIEHLSDHKKNHINSLVDSQAGVSLYDKHHVLLDPGFLSFSVGRLDESLSALIGFIEERYPYLEGSST